MSNTKPVSEAASSLMRPDPHHRFHSAVPAARQAVEPVHPRFGANTVIISVATGALLVSKGVGFGWSVLAIVLGFGLGTFLAAFHSAQGPEARHTADDPEPGTVRLRRRRGADAGGGGCLYRLLRGQPGHRRPGGERRLGSQRLPGRRHRDRHNLRCCTFRGVQLLASWARDLSVAAVIVFGIFTGLLFTHSGIPHPTTSNLHGGFSEGLFLAVAPVLHLRRWLRAIRGGLLPYMPPDSSVKATAWWSYGGIAISGIWLFTSWRVPHLDYWLQRRYARLGRRRHEQPRYGLHLRLRDHHHAGSWFCKARCRSTRAGTPASASSPRCSGAHVR